jgi:MFS transporter, SHS family, lactate transporter
LILPETTAFDKQQAVRIAKGSIGKVFIEEGKVVLRRHWLLLTYLVILLAGFNSIVSQI